MLSVCDFCVKQDGVRYAIYTRQMITAIGAACDLVSHVQYQLYTEIMKLVKACHVDVH